MRCRAAVDGDQRARSCSSSRARPGRRRRCATSSTVANAFIGICLRIPLPPSFSIRPATSSVGAKPGQHRVDADAEARQLHGAAAGEGVDRALRGGVVRLADPAALAHHRRDVDDHAVALAHEVGERGLRAVEDAAEVDPHHVEPVVRLHVVDQRVLGDAGVVDQDVQAAELLDRLLRPSPRPARTRRRRPATATALPPAALIASTTSSACSLPGAVVDADRRALGGERLGTRRGRSRARRRSPARRVLRASRGYMALPFRAVKAAPCRGMRGSSERCRFTSTTHGSTGAGAGGPISWPTRPDELHRAAAQLGLRREWAQERGRTLHYDLPDELRARAIELGLAGRRHLARARAAARGARARAPADALAAAASRGRGGDRGSARS